MEQGAKEILAKHGCLYMKDDYKALFEELEAYYKPTEAVKNNVVLPFVIGRVYGQTVTGTLFKHKVLKHSRSLNGNEYYLIKNIETGHKQIINGCELHAL